MKWLVLGFIAIGMGSALAEQPAVSGPLARSLNDAFAGVYEKVAPSVVVIEVQGSDASELEGLPEGLQFFFQKRNPQGPSVQTNQGSGFFIAKEGYIVTNNHVVENALEGGIMVTLKDGRKLKATLVGADEKADIAVLKVEGENLPVAEFADSDAVKVGQFAFAIGAPFDLPYTFTVGVISAKGRNGLLPTGNRLPVEEEFIQTDASINPGNSGGPLCDIDGKIVGINTMISGMNRGLGFAVPINLAREVTEQLIANGHVSRSWLGIGIIGVEEIENSKRFFPTIDSGVIVTDVWPGTPAEGSGLQQRDVITKVDGVAVAKARDLQREILSKTVGQTVKLDVARGDQTVVISLRTAEQPAPKVTRASNRRPSSPYEDPGATPPTRKAVPRSTDGTPGLTLAPTLPEDSVGGARVESVVEGSPAETAGFLPGDVIVEAGGRPVRSSEEMEQILKQADLARGLMIIVDRNGSKTYGILKQ